MPLDHSVAPPGAAGNLAHCCAALWADSMADATAKAAGKASAIAVVKASLSMVVT